MNEDFAAGYCYSEHYRPEQVVPANPPSFWNEVDVIVLDQAISSVLEMSTARDGDLSDEDVALAKSQFQR